MKSFLACLAAASATIALASISHAAEVEWTPEANMDHQLFPSLLIATATARPIEEDDAEAKTPDPYLLGERFGLVGVSIKSPAAKTKVKVTLKENELMAATNWTGELAEADKEYYIAPKVTYKFEKLRKAQQMPLNVSFAVELDGKSAGRRRKHCRSVRLTIVPSASRTRKKLSTTKTSSPARPRSAGCSPRM